MMEARLATEKPDTLAGLPLSSFQGPLKGMEMKEIWKDVPGYEGLYQVSNLGRVKSLGKWVTFKRRKDSVPGRYWRLGIEMKPTITEKGYQWMRLIKNGKYSGTWQVHRMVLEAFVGPCPDGMECRHFPDNNPSNNRLDNLSWATHYDNIQDRYFHNTYDFGEDNTAAKLTEEDVALIKRLRDRDKRKYLNYRGPKVRGREYPYGYMQRIQKKFTKRTGKQITPTMIGFILRGQNWTHLI